ncbi:hypothetical protein MTO96_019108 [Rhipicephalus appendiculatus]
MFLPFGVFDYCAREELRALFYRQAPSRLCERGVDTSSRTVGSKRVPRDRAELADSRFGRRAATDYARSRARSLSRAAWR